MSFHLNVNTQWESMQYNREMINTAAHLTGIAMLTFDSELKPFLCFISSKNFIVF